MYLKPLSLLLNPLIYLSLTTFTLATTGHPHRTEQLVRKFPLSTLVKADEPPLLPLRRPHRQPQPPTKPHTIRLSTLRAFPPSPSAHKSHILTQLTTLLERIYDFLAHAALLNSFLDAHDLTVRIGDFRFDFYSEVEVLSVLAIREVVRRLGQLVQGGLTGLVSGEVVGVGGAVRMGFVVGVG